MNIKNLSGIIIASLSMIVIFASCHQGTDESSLLENGFGNVNLRLGFSKANITRATTPSTSKPTTSWSQNIKQLMALFVDNTGYIKAARTLLIPQENSTNEFLINLQNIPAGNYEVYLIANYNETNIDRPNTKALWNEGNVVGKSIRSFSLSLVKNSAYIPNASTEAEMIGYKEPAELFIDKKSVRIIPDQTTTMPPFRLTRSVSILRVRIDQSFNGNDVIDFLAPQSSLRVRKISTSFNLMGTFSDITKKDVLYTSGNGLFKNTDPTDGYTSGKILDPANNITLWSDILIFPGGSKSEGAKKFDIVIGGIAPAGYTPFGSDTPLTNPELVYWNAQIQTDIVSNNILEVNCIIKQAGSTEVPLPGTYGNIDMNINIEDWGNITSADIEV